jgi:hypothetical protein
MNIFEQAAKSHLRFTTDLGTINVEDVWDLALETSAGLSLDTLARDLSHQIRDLEEGSFVSTKSTADTLVQLRMDIVLYIIKVRLAEQEARTLTAENKLKRTRILEIIADKEDTSLKNKSLASLRKLVEELE